MRPRGRGRNVRASDVEEAIMDMKKLLDDAKRILGIDIATSPSGRHYYYAAETRSYYWVTTSDLRYARKVGRAYPSDAYSHWCAGTGSREMSAASAKRLGLT
jgi:hypothetical protein